MKNKQGFVIGLLVLFLLLYYAATFQVRFTESAVVTTLGRVQDGGVVHGDQKETGLLGNLYFKWPWPIQKVQLYDRRIHRLQDRLEETQTMDSHTVVLSTYVTWRIDKPLDFFRSVRTVENAESKLRSWLRDARSELGRFRFDELANMDPAQLRLGDLEKQMRQKMQDNLKKQEMASGVVIESVGIKRLVLTQQVAEDVLEKMRKNRERMAAAAEAEGKALAEAIEKRAMVNSQTILSFARHRAEMIRAEGDQAATQHYHAFKADESLAAFLLKMDAYKKIFDKNLTIFLDAKDGLGIEFLQPPVAGDRQAINAAD